LALFSRWRRITAGYRSHIVSPDREKFDLPLTYILEFDLITSRIKGHPTDYSQAARHQ
jgi:hypothetical protein